MAVLRIRTLEVLAATIERLCPDLQGRVCAGPAEHPKRLGFPSLAIIPAAYSFFPDQDGEVWFCPDAGNTAVFKVGRHEATIQLRLGAKTARQRYALEHAVSQIFISQRRRPGVLVVQVPDCWNAVVAYEFDQTEWRNELAFDKQWYSIASVTVQLPALVERGGVYTIEELRSCFTEDLSTPIESVPAAQVECVSIDESGNITVASPSP